VRIRSRSVLRGVSWCDQVSLAPGPATFSRHTTKLAPEDARRVKVKIRHGRRTGTGTRWLYMAPGWSSGESIGMVRALAGLGRPLVREMPDADSRGDLLDPYIGGGCESRACGTRNPAVVQRRRDRALVDAGDTRASAYTAISPFSIAMAQRPALSIKDRIRHSRAALRREVLAEWEPGDDAIRTRLGRRGGQVYTGYGSRTPSTADTRISIGPAASRASTKCLRTPRLYASPS